MDCDGRSHYHAAIAGLASDGKAGCPGKALIGAGGDEGPIFDGTDRERSRRFAEGVSDTDAKSCSSGLSPRGHFHQD